MEADAVAVDVEPAAQVKLTLAPKLNLALHQNAVPFLRELAVTNNGPEPLWDVTVTLSSTPSFLTSKVWRLEEIGPGQTYHLPDLDVSLDGALLATLTEAQAAQAMVVVTADGEELARIVREVELLARNQWGGVGTMPELAAAFVQPNDPVVDRILKKAAGILREHGKSAALDGYDQGSKHAWEVASAVWAAVAALGLDYALAPASFEVTGQKVRSPGQILDAGLATCLETAFLLSAALEQCGLNPLIVFTRGHAFAGVWLKDEQFSTVVVDDITSLRKRVKLKELVLFETTFVCQRPAPGFGAATERGARQISEAEEDKFELAMDLRRARLQRVRPLGAGSDDKAAPATGDSDALEDLPPVFEEAPDLPQEAVVQDVETPQTPAGRLDRWQRKLLDLSLRNSLLNFRASKRVIRLDAPDPGRLEDMLADGKALRLRPRPDLMDGHDERSSVIHESRTREDVRRAHALDALQKGEVLADLRQEDLDSRLVELYRQARATLQEGGANTLFLALGFLSWTRDDKDDKRYRAPLILIPVTLHRKSVRSGFSLTLHDDEPRFNPTLVEMLRQDFKLSIPVVEGELPKDDSGLDVAGIWRAVGEAVKDVRGWEVTEDVVLATFSFAKYLMWKDLVERTEHLKQNAVVRHLIETPRDPYPSDLRFPDPRTLDAEHTPQQTFCPLPADSSQLSAVMAAAKGKDFVLVGPPGTGKSQTIANLIAQCLAERKTVLFVSEKIAALDVVYRRLRDVGLGEFCLELHSSKARKLDVLEQLRKSWDAKGSVDAAQWKAEAERLKSLRDQLNLYVERLHRRYRNGLTPHRALGRVIANPDVPHIGLSWPSVDAHDAEALQHLRDLAERLDIDARAVGGVTGTPLALIAHGDWSPSWQQSLLDAAQAVLPLAQDVENAAAAFVKAAGLPDVTLNRRGRDALTDLATVLPEAAGRDWRFVLRPDVRTLVDQLRQGLGLLVQHEEEKAALSQPYDGGALALDLPALQATWSAAEDAWFLKAWISRRAVRKALAPVTAGKPPVNPSGDLDRLLKMKALEGEIADLEVLQAQTGGLWAGLKTRTADVDAALSFQERLSVAIAALSETAETSASVKAAIDRLLGDANAMLDPSGPLAGAGKTYQDSLARYEEGAVTFLGLAGAEEPATGDLVTPGDLADACRAILPLKPKLHAWCAWRKARAEALSVGLGPLVGVFENGAATQGTLADAFDVAYCRWWINAVVDDDEVLRGFVSAEHEKRIHDFRALDERFTALTRDYLRAGLCSGLPNQEDVGKSSEWGILRREMEKKRRHMPLRELVTRLPTALTKLAPCLLMSPLSIAQYLSAETALFDVVVFDEASQIPVWDAVGAIARGRQVVMVGDPKQLPPTNFFGRGESEADEEDVEIESDLESILDECLGANLPTLDLSWHYRSRHESLIAFSNHRYYGGGLVTFPSPVTEDRAVSFRFVADGIYEKGGSRINQPEARALVADLVSRLKDPLFKDASLTIGVVTFNSEQQRLIEDLLDEERRKDPNIEPFFAEDALEPVFVKNLESVQGDERDIMYFSVTYGPDRTGAVSMNFGPMNKDGGERRLNVAVTRARHELRVFSSLRPEQIDLSRTQALGVRDLKHFLEFADRGPRALAEAVFGTIGDYDSPFEKAVADALGRKGWQVHPQVGVSSFRIDLGVVDPDAPGRYLAGVECDGATYHRSATARDRDKLREQVLRGLGWEILRIWSTDWWHDADGALEKVHARLEEFLISSRARRAAEAEAETATQEEPSEDAANSAVGVADKPEVEGQHDEGAPAVAGRQPDVASDTEARPVYARRDTSQPLSEGAARARVFREADPAEAVAADPDAFLDPAYDETLATMVAHVIAVEGPVREDVLAKRIARAHGWARTGARIRERVAEVAAKRHLSTKEDVGTFYWPPEADVDAPWPFAEPVVGIVRSIDEIALPELISFAQTLRRQGLQEEEGLTIIARAAGLQKLRKTARERLEAAWQMAGRAP